MNEKEQKLFEAILTANTEPERLIAYYKHGDKEDAYKRLVEACASKYYAVEGYGDSILDPVRALGWTFDRDTIRKLMVDITEAAKKR